MNARILREPLFHFLLLGAALFVIDALGGDGADTESRHIEVSPQRIEQLATVFQRTWQRPPTPQELDGLIEDFVKEEIYYREARALGLDQDDTIIRRRLRQKLEFLTDEAGSAASPTDEELEAFLEEHADAYRFPPLLSLRQIYFSVDRRGESAADDARELLGHLPAGRWPEDGETLGDRLLLTVPESPSSPTEIARLFGERFAAAVAALPVGVWSGPVESGYGLHLVLVTERRDGRMPALEEVRREVERDWFARRRERVAEEFYGELRRRYDVVVRMPGSESDAAGGGR